MKSPLVFFFITIMIFSLHAEQEDNLSELIQTTGEKNLEIIKLSRQVEKAIEDIPRIIIIEDSKITFSNNFII